MRALRYLDSCVGLIELQEIRRTATIHATVNNQNHDLTKSCVPVVKDMGVGRIDSQWRWCAKPSMPIHCEIWMSQRGRVRQQGNNAWFVKIQSISNTRIVQKWTGWARIHTKESCIEYISKIQCGERERIMQDGSCEACPQYWQTSPDDERKCIRKICKPVERVTKEAQCRQC